MAPKAPNVHLMYSVLRKSAFNFLSLLILLLSELFGSITTHRNSVRYTIRVQYRTVIWNFFFHCIIVIVAAVLGVVFFLEKHTFEYCVKEKLLLISTPGKDDAD